MDFTFNDEQNMLRDTVRRFTENEIKPLAARIDKEKKVPRELINKVAELGLFGIPFPEQYGGSGMGEIGYCIMLEEVSRGCASTTVTLAAHMSLCSTAIYISGTEEQKQKYLTQLIHGRKIGAFGLTEPQAGSDAANIQTTAVRDGDYYIINGNKIWITNGDIADVIVVFAVTDEILRAKGGITVFIVERDFPGFSVGKVEDKMGIRGSSTAELVFQEMRVPKENILGQFGAGFITAMKTLDIGRVTLGAGCLGAAREALKMSVEFAKKRVQFGVPIAEKQAVQWMIAEMAADIYAMENMVYRTAWMCDRGMKFTKESAICKMFCSEALDRVVDKAVQIHGGLGYMADYPIERFYRDARINRIFEGTNEIQRMVIAENVLKGGE